MALVIIQNKNFLMLIWLQKVIKMLCSPTLENSLFSSFLDVPITSVAHWNAVVMLGFGGNVSGSNVHSAYMNVRGHSFLYSWNTSTLFDSVQGYPKRNQNGTSFLFSV